MRQKLIISICLFLAIDLLLVLCLVFVPQVKSNDAALSITHIPLKTEEKVKEKIVREAQSLKLLKRERLKTGRSVKSVLFSPNTKYLYTLNLEGGSVYEFDQKTRKVNRELIFKQTKAKGYDYETRKWLDNSFAEKPVEGHFTHDGKYLWISLHLSLIHI